MLLEKSRLISLEPNEDEDELEEAQLGSRRRESADNLFEIIPQTVITHLPEDINLDDGEITLSKIKSLAGSGDYGLFSGCRSRVVAATGGTDILGVCSDNEVLFLEKHSTSEPAQRVGFTSRVDFLLWRRSVILIGLSSAEIVLLDPRTFEIKETKKLGVNAYPEKPFFIHASIHSNPNPTEMDLIVIDRTGYAYLFNNIALSDGTLDSTHDQNVSVDIDVGSVKGSKIKCLESPTADVVCAASPSRDTVILGESNGMISIHHNISKPSLNLIRGYQGINIIQHLEILQICELKKVIHFEGLIFALLSNGDVQILLNDVLVPTEPFKLPTSGWIVHDFVLVLTAEAEIKLWAVYGDPETAIGENYVGIFGGLSFSVEFSVKIPLAKASILPGVSRTSTFHFPLQTTPYEEPFAVIEASHVGTIVYQMTETSTDATFQKLIAKGKFDQAQEFALKYAKEVDLVHKAKAKTLFNKITPMENSHASPEFSLLFKELIATLDRIQDSSFVCWFCCQDEIPDINSVKDLLNVGKARVKHCSSTEIGKTFLLKLQKFYTFRQVFPGGTIQDWLAFVSEENSMFQQCRWFLNKPDFGKCEKVWRRHFDEFITTITLNDFGPFLYVLFGEQLKSTESVSLMKCIFPFAVEKCAESELNDSRNTSLGEIQLRRVDILVDIVKKQLGSLERDKSWPSDGIEFLKMLISITREEISKLENSRDREEIKITIQTLICQEIQNKLEFLLQNLFELANLKTNHSIRIPFQDYINEDVVEVVNSMFYALFQRDEIEKFIQVFLLPFARRKAIDVDTLYLEHVRSVVSDLPFHLNTFNIPHEERLICLLENISSLEKKLLGVLKIAEEWPVPWSPNIDNMVMACLRMNAEDKKCIDWQNIIRIMRKQVPFRCLLSKYRLSATKVMTYSGVVMAISRMIKLEKPDYKTDCLELIKHTGKVDEAKIQSIEFSLQLRNPKIPVEDMTVYKSSRGILKRLLARMLQEFRLGCLDMFTEEELKRNNDASAILANNVGANKAVEFFKLKTFIPNLQNFDDVLHEEFPFSLLSNIMTQSENSSDVIISKCQKLADVTFYQSVDLLIAASAFFAHPTVVPKDGYKVWDLLRFILDLPSVSFFGRNSSRGVVTSAALSLAQFLMCSCPYLKEYQMDILNQLLMALVSLNDIMEDVLKMLSSYKIFLGLREQEIPLEEDFLTIYQWLYVESCLKPDIFFKALENFGSNILKFGDRDLFNQAFGCIRREYMSRSILLKGKPALQMIVFADRIHSLQLQLINSFDELVEPETDKFILGLIKEMHEVGLLMTPYALRQRDKSQLLKKLLGMNHYLLAAQTAIVFKAYADDDVWSEILRGIIESGDNQQLRRILEDLRNVSELWMLPEFADGWRRISEQDPQFRDLCPIPLD